MAAQRVNGESVSLSLALRGFAAAPVFVTGNSVPPAVELCLLNPNDLEFHISGLDSSFHEKWAPNLSYLVQSSKE